MSKNRSRVLLCALIASGLVGTTPVLAQNQLPVDPRQEMDRLDEQVLGKQRELFAARQRQDDAAVERLTKEFKEIQEQRAKTLKAARHLY